LRVAQGLAATLSHRLWWGGQRQPRVRHGRACPGLSRPSTQSGRCCTTWMPGTSPGMTRGRSSRY